MFLDSRRRFTMTRITNTLMATCAALSLTMTGGASAAHATHFTGGEIFVFGGNTTGAPTTFSNTIDIELVALSLSSVDPVGNDVQLPPPGGTFQIDSFFDVFVELTIDGNIFQIDSFFDVFVFEIQNNIPPQTSTGDWDTEMVQLSLTGQVPGGPVIELRASPSLPSPGEVDVSDLPDGTFQVDSFFDVFFEVSVDGGAFNPAASPTRIVMDAITPEPASLALMALGLTMCGRIGSRRSA
jgi:hypothetical protein